MNIQHDVPLAEKTWFKTGGPARSYCEPTTPQEFQDALTFALSKRKCVFLLGEGANILISDEGFDGLVVRPALHSISIEKNARITAGAGVSFAYLIDYCLAHNLGGLEEFSGIPGTVGGSVYINIHYFEFLLSQFLVSAQIINSTTGKTSTVDQNWFEFGYDQSKLMEKQHYVLSATFQLRCLDDLQTAYARGRRDEIVRHREKRYPLERTCGSFFRNFHAHELKSCTHPQPLPYVAYYLDTLGLKGKLKSGNASVSTRHANMIVTHNGATSSDVIELARAMQKAVQLSYGIIPQPECQLIGYATNPLL